MEKERYEKIIDVLIGQLELAEWRLERAEQEIKELKAENKSLRSEKCNSET